MTHCYTRVALLRFLFRALFSTTIQCLHNGVTTTDPQQRRSALECEEQVFKKKEMMLRAKTYNSGDSPVVTHLTTNPPISCLTRAERTGSRDLKILWSYVANVAFRRLTYSVVHVSRSPTAVQPQHPWPNKPVYTSAEHVLGDHSSRISGFHLGESLAVHVPVDIDITHIPILVATALRTE